MCLNTKQKRPFRVTESFTVYKVLNELLQSPYRGFPYSIGSEYHFKFGEGDFCPLDNLEGTLRDSLGFNSNNWKENPGWKSIGAGFHAYSHYERALGAYDPERQVIVEGLVPKGAKAYFDYTGCVVVDKVKIQGFFKDPRI